MTNTWTPRDTTTHQDHVIAHVVGATVLGYFVFDEALYLLLDMGFVWTILLDGEMSLLPHPVAMKEIEIDEVSRQEINADISVLLGNIPVAVALLRMQTPGVECEIEEVTFFERGGRRLLRLKGEKGNLSIETSLDTAEIVMTSETGETDGAEPEKSLKDAAESEHQYLHQRLREELGREPTEEELDEWLRQHTEGY
ncbi:MAG TPA: hypothetical protein VMS31_19075 [Pyrinomonadaceae bacterium]|nr:hypothetical protein [Pyrinomonadaceae bacterium]